MKFLLTDKRFAISFLLILLCCVIFSCSPQKTEKSVNGKIVLVVLDISASIKKQFPTLRQKMTENFIKKRLNIGDYFVLITFGDDVRVEYSGKIMRGEDIDTICGNFNRLSALDGKTDIGGALKKTLEEIIDLKSRDYNLFEPTVLFITDGSHDPKQGTLFYGKGIKEIFTDDTIGNKSLYNGWYYLAIGATLNDIKQIASLSGRSDYLFTIDDLGKFDMLLDRWLNSIKPPKPLEAGEVVFKKISINGRKLTHGKTIKIPYSSPLNLNLSVKSTYEKTAVFFEILGVEVEMENYERGIYKSVSASFETKKLQIEPTKLHKIKMDVDTDIFNNEKYPVSIKTHIKYAVNETPYEHIVEGSIYPVNKLLFLVSLLKIPLLLLFLVLIVYFITRMVSAYKPLRITAEAEVGGIRNNIRVAVGREIEIGTKAGSDLRLDGVYESVIAKLKRIGGDKWELKIISPKYFEDDIKSVSRYTLGSWINIKDDRGREERIRFKLMRSGEKERRRY